MGSRGEELNANSEWYQHLPARVGQGPDLLNIFTDKLPALQGITTSEVLQIYAP